MCSKNAARERDWQEVNISCHPEDSRKSALGSNQTLFVQRVGAMGRTVDGLKSI